MKYIVVGIVLVGIFAVLVEYLRYYKRVCKLFTSGKDLKLKDIIVFSYKELSRYIRSAFFCNSDIQYIKVLYFKDKYMAFNREDSYDVIIGKLHILKEYLRENAGYIDSNEHLRDNLDIEILKMWLKYGNYDDYRKLCKGKLNDMYSAGEISKSTYNRMYGRFCQINSCES